VQKTPEVDAFWHTFTATVDGLPPEYVVVSFGDTPAMQDALADLVASGTKRATTSLLRDYATGDEPVPRVGDLAVVVDGTGAPCCIYRVTQVDVKPLSAVDDHFAWDEGEGDRTLAWWMDAHRAYFTRQAAREQILFHDEIEVVLERFEVVWPADVADRTLASLS